MARVDVKNEGNNCFGVTERDFLRMLKNAGRWDEAVRFCEPMVTSKPFHEPCRVELAELKRRAAR